MSDDRVARNVDGYLDHLGPPDLGIVLGLAGMLDVLPESRHRALHRRLGDLSLFLAGVFPDHTAGRAFRPIEGVAERFVNARRALNLLADRHLFDRARSWFPSP